MTWNWFSLKRIAISKSWLFDFPSAENDLCLRCAVKRKYHVLDHAFVEKESKEK